MDAAFREANRQDWEPQVHSRVSDYRSFPSLEQDRTRVSSLEKRARDRCHDAFYLLAGGEDELALRVAEYAAAVAREALRTESFERMFYRRIPTPDGLEKDDPTFQPTPLMEQVQRTRGVMHCREVLHYCHWFRSGERPMDLWAEVVDVSREFYELFCRQYLEQERTNALSLAPILRKYVEGEQFESASELYWKDYRNPLLELPNDLGVLRGDSLDDDPEFEPEDSEEYVEAYAGGRVQTLYALAEHLRGQAGLRPLARAGVEHWFHQCRDWTTGVAGLSAFDRLGWAYLYGKHFSGVTELRPLLHDLRGY